jgi:hypothetical protein
MGLNNLQTNGTGGIAPGGLRNLTEIGAISAIPDTQLTRPTDDSASTNSGKWGVAVQANVDFDGLKAEISANSSGATTAYVTETDGTVLNSTDISSLVAGESFSIAEPLSSGSTYYLVVDNGGSGWTVGSKQGGLSYPITGQAFDLTAGVFSGTSTTTNNAYAVNNIRNLNY